MTEIVKINLDNEMDLILAHKRTLKIGELCGLSVASQTTFATAVSEIARCAISFGKKSFLILRVETIRLNKKEIVASIFDLVDLSKKNSEAFSYAKRLMGDIQASKDKQFYEIRLSYAIPYGGLISDQKIQSFKDYFQNEPPISPYDEIRKKNVLLIDMANKLQESERQYQLLTDTLPLMMFALNNTGELNYSNKWLKDFFKMSLSVVNTTSWQSLIHQEDYENIGKAWDHARANRTVFRAQGRLLNQTGEMIWHLITIVPVKNQKETLLHWIGFFVDIHSEKLVEETLKDNKALRETQKKLKKNQAQLEQKINELNISNYNLEQFAFIASHDLQEPLRKIKTFSNVLQDELELSDEQKRYFNKIKSSSDRMSTLIKDVLDYSRLSTSDHGMVDTDLNLILENVLIDMELIIQEKNAQITITDFPVLKVVPLQITQLFSNIIHNSLKFSQDEPVIAISSRKLSDIQRKKVAELDQKKDYYHFTFKDHGIGFSREFNDRIFDIFQRLSPSEYPGTGIGLALCKRIVNNHHGCITANGTEGKGAVFNIYLPY